MEELTDNQSLASQQPAASSQKLVLIMAGGAGTRFWPASREENPKQFLDILGTGKSLLRQTYERSKRLVPDNRIFIITNAAYAERIHEELPELSDEQVFLEPSRNNTAPSVAYASLKLHARYPDAVCLVAPSDHIIQDEDTFIEVVEKAFAFAGEHDVLVTLGISPTRPDTGYGYVQQEMIHSDTGIYPVVRFTEKPNQETAKEFLTSGDYHWNSGMFIWSLKSILGAFETHAANILDILKPGLSVFYSPDEAGFLAKYYPQTENLSIDYAILERAANVYVIPASFGWSDLGTWVALYDHLPADGDGNITVHAPVLLDQCKGTLVFTKEGKLVVASGLQDFIIVCEEDAILIFPKEKEQEIKMLRAELKLRGEDKYL